MEVNNNDTRIKLRTFVVLEVYTATLHYNATLQCNTTMQHYTATLHIHIHIHMHIYIYTYTYTYTVPITAAPTPSRKGSTTLLSTMASKNSCPMMVKEKAGIKMPMVITIAPEVGSGVHCERKNEIRTINMHIVRTYIFVNALIDTF